MQIFLNDEPAFWLYEAELRRLGLHLEDELDEEMQEEIRSRLVVRHAQERSAEILARRDKTERQLRELMLREGYDAETVDQAAESMKEQHFLDDGRYAQMYIEGRKDRKSPQQLRMELREAGIADETIEEAFAQTELPGEEALILRWAEKKHFDPQEAAWEEKEKFISFLLRKGFSRSAIREVLK